MLRSQKGFTLIELIVIIVIIGILAAVAVPRYVDLTTAARDGTARGVLGGLRSSNTLLFASRIVNSNNAAYTWQDISNSAQLQGVTWGLDNNYFTLTVAGNNYCFSIGPTTPAAPNTPATIWASTNTW